MNKNNELKMGPWLNWQEFFFSEALEVENIKPAFNKDGDSFTFFLSGVTVVQIIKNV